MSKINPQDIISHVVFCNGKSCTERGAEQSSHTLNKLCKKQGIGNAVLQTTIPCTGNCGKGPVAIIYPDGIWYGKCTKKNIKKLFRRTVVQNKLLKKNMLGALKRKKQ